MGIKLTIDAIKRNLQRAKRNLKQAEKSRREGISWLENQDTLQPFEIDFYCLQKELSDFQVKNARQVVSLFEKELNGEGEKALDDAISKERKKDPSFDERIAEWNRRNAAGEFDHLKK